MTWQHIYIDANDGNHHIFPVQGLRRNGEALGKALGILVTPHQSSGYKHENEPKFFGDTIIHFMKTVAKRLEGFQDRPTVERIIKEIRELFRHGFFILINFQQAQKLYIEIAEPVCEPAA